MATKLSQGFAFLEDENGNPIGMRRARDGADFTLVRQDTSTGSLVGAGGYIGEFVDFAAFSPALDGVTDDTTKFLAACAASVSLNRPLLLPPGTFVISQTASVRSIVGVPGKSKIILAPDFTLTGYANQFAFINPSFGLTYNSSTADAVYFAGFDVEVSPNSTLAIFGLGNIKAGLFDRVNIKANKVIGGDSKPVVVQALIDLYVACKNVTISRCLLQNLTDGYKTTPVATDGGGTIWVRNFTNNGADENNATENIWITENTIQHKTSDEAIAVYGCNGITRRVHVVGNNIHGLDSTSYHSALVSAFPLDLGAGTAQVYDVEFSQNVITDRSFLYNVVRFGASADAARPCFNIKSRGNIITAYRSSNGTTGPKAVWVANGSVGTDPDVGSIVLRNIIGTVGSGFPSSFQSNTSIGDTIYCPSGGAQVNTGISSFDLVDDAHIQGNVYTGVASCASVTGGVVNAFGRAFYNVDSIVGTRWKVDGYSVAEYDSASAARFLLANTTGSSAGAFVKVSGTAAHRVSVIGNVGAMTSGTALNNTNANATITARCNDLQGTVSTIAAGAVTRSLNNWAGTTD